MSDQKLIIGNNTIHIKCIEYGIKNYVIQPDGLVDVDGNVHIHDKYITILPIMFGVVSGDFSCSRNQLRSLIGAPNEVGGTFDCSDNSITSLLYSPMSVGGDFICSENNLKSLELMPSYIGGILKCRRNILNLNGVVKTLFDNNMRYSDIECFFSDNEIISVMRKYVLNSIIS